MTGEVVQRDDGIAAQWLKVAVDAGEVDTNVFDEDLLVARKAVAQDISEAVHLYREAADAENPRA
jgi:TPR repeat protein